MIEIDGNQGDGGGQILRTSLALSCILKKPFRIYDIRKSRTPAGLRPQHLMAVNAARAIGGADVSGAHVGSRNLLFKPHYLQGGSYRLDIGTAGAISLVLQTVVPPLLFAGGKSTVDLIGGTHVTFSPSFEYVEQVFIPMIQKLGCDIRVHLETAGFYPRGGGRVHVEVAPVGQLYPLELVERGPIVEVSGFSAVSNLPAHIAERQMRAAEEHLAFLGCPVRIHQATIPSPGQGSYIFLRADTPVARAGFEGLGERGKPADRVGTEAAEKLRAWANTGAAVDSHLADQVLLYLVLSGRRSVFTTEAITPHLMTNLRVIQSFTQMTYEIEEEENRPGRVVIN